MVATNKARRRAGQRRKFDHLFAVPSDPDNAVAVLRWCVACWLDHLSVEQIASEAGMDAGRLFAFLESDAADAGELLTLAEAAGLMRVVEVRIEDREAVAELGDYVEVAKPYIELARFDFDAAARHAREVRDAFLAVNPDAARWADSDESERTVSV